VAGVDEKGPSMFQTEPSGALAQYKSVAVGRNKDRVMGVFEKEYKDGISLDKAIVLAYKALQQSLPEKEKISLNRVEFAIVDEIGFRLIDEQELKKYLKQA